MCVYAYVSVCLSVIMSSPLFMYLYKSVSVCMKMCLCMCIHVCVCVIIMYLSWCQWVHVRLLVYLLIVCLSRGGVIHFGGPSTLNGGGMIPFCKKKNNLPMCIPEPKPDTYPLIRYSILRIRSKLWRHAECQKHSFF